MAYKICHASFILVKKCFIGRSVNKLNLKTQKWSIQRRPIHKWRCKLLPTHHQHSSPDSCTMLLSPSTAATFGSWGVALLCGSVKCQQDVLEIRQSKCEMLLGKMRSASPICGPAEYPIYLQPAYRQQPRNGCGGISGERGFCLPTRENLILFTASLSMKLIEPNSISFTLLVTTRWNQS